jgi:tripeptide aminopeptidase
MATIPATTHKNGVQTIGFIAHVDTSPEMPGAGVKPIVHRNYDGGDLVLPDEPGLVLREADNPELAAQRGNDIITASGKTLLGSDDKAGVAEIMAARNTCRASRHPHGPVKIAFTPDEEVGRGTQYFDVNRFGARFAYTLDGPTVGDLEIENFSADAMTVTFKGFNAHPGYAKGRMVSAIKLAAEFVQRLPRHGMSPETTDGWATCRTPSTAPSGASVKLLLGTSAPRSTTKPALTGLAEDVVRPFPSASIQVDRQESYRI